MFQVRKAFDGLSIVVIWNHLEMPYVELLSRRICWIWKLDATAEDIGIAPGSRS